MENVDDVTRRLDLGREEEVVRRGEIEVKNFLMEQGDDKEEDYNSEEEYDKSFTQFNAQFIRN